MLKCLLSQSLTRFIENLRLSALRGVHMVEVEGKCFRGGLWIWYFDGGVVRCLQDDISFTFVPAQRPYATNDLYGTHTSLG